MRLGRFSPEILIPQQLFAVIEAEDVEVSAGFIDLAGFPGADERSWYLAPESRFVDPRPGRWQLDQDLDLVSRSVSEREWRDSVIVRAFSMRDRHRDEVELGMATTLTPEQFAELLVYIQQLRDWPQSEQFPAAEHRPALPAWYQPGE
jgi:hypothetical protein